MAHLMAQEAQEEIQEEGEQASEEVQPLVTEAETAATVATVELQEPPETAEGMAYRLGQLEATLAAQTEQIAALTALVQTQNAEIAAAHAQMEVQEEVLEEVAEEESAEGHELPIWERLMGGGKKRKR